jgi:hypothetical protein
MESATEDAQQACVLYGHVGLAERLRVDEGAGYWCVLHGHARLAESLRVEGSCYWCHNGVCRWLSSKPSWISFCGRKIGGELSWEGDAYIESVFPLLDSTYFWIIFIREHVHLIVLGTLLIIATTLLSCSWPSNQHFSSIYTHCLVVLFWFPDACRYTAGQNVNQVINDRWVGVLFYYHVISEVCIFSRT